MLFQELFYGPYFCQVQDPQYYSYTEHIPDGPTTKRMQDLAKQTGMVLVVPMYEEDDEASGIYYNTAAVIDADGKYLGKYRKTHIPHVKGFWEKYYFRPGNLGYPVFETAVGKVGVYICYDRHFPEGARALGLNGAEMVFIPSRHVARPVRVPVARRAGQPRRSPTATSSGRSTGSASSRLGDDDFYGQSYFVDPRGQFIGAVGSRARRGAARPRHGPRPDHRGPPDLAVLPGPPARRVRRPRRAVAPPAKWGFRPARAFGYDPARLGCQGGGQPSPLLSGGRRARCSSGSRSSRSTRSSARSP